MTSWLGGDKGFASFSASEIPAIVDSSGCWGLAPEQGCTVEKRSKGKLTAIVRKNVRKGSKVMTHELLSYDELNSEYQHKVI